MWASKIGRSSSDWACAVAVVGASSSASSSERMSRPYGTLTPALSQRERELCARFLPLARESSARLCRRRQRRQAVGYARVGLTRRQLALAYPVLESPSMHR